MLYLQNLQLTKGALQYILVHTCMLFGKVFNRTCDCLSLLNHNSTVCGKLPGFIVVLLQCDYWLVDLMNCVLSQVMCTISFDCVNSCIILFIHNFVSLCVLYLHMCVCVVHLHTHSCMCVCMCVCVCFSQSKVLSINITVLPNYELIVQRKRK